MTIPFIKFLEEHGIKTERVIKRYLQICRMLNCFISENNLTDNVIFDRKNLLLAVSDYFVDLVRIKEFHGIEHTNVEKVYSYLAYWLLKRKPLQINKYFYGSEFINELFVSKYIISSVSNARGIDDDVKNKYPSFRKFHIMLYYNLCFRIVTQQSLELMIDAFFGGYDFTT